MKNLIVTFILLLSTSLIMIAQNSCSVYYPFTEGATAEITSYDRKDRVAAVVTYTVEEVRDTGDALVATMSSQIKDEDNEELAETTYDITCADDKIAIDFKSMISPQMMEQFGDMDYEVTGSNLEIPNSLSVGQSLPDADLQMKINMAGINMNMNVAITDREVTGQETVTTPAGTFDCYVIRYTVETKMGMGQRGTALQWIAEGVGMVKQVDYNKRGKVTSKSLLTAFSE